MIQHGRPFQAVAGGANPDEVVPVGEEPPSINGRDAHRVYQDHQTGVHHHRRMDACRAGEAIVRPQVRHPVVQRLANKGLEYVEGHRGVDYERDKKRDRKMFAFGSLHPGGGVPVAGFRHGVRPCQSSKNNQRADRREKEPPVEVGVDDAGDREDEAEVEIHHVQHGQKLLVDVWENHVDDRRKLRSRSFSKEQDGRTTGGRIDVYLGQVCSTSFNSLVIR